MAGFWLRWGVTGVELGKLIRTHAQSRFVSIPWQKSCACRSAHACIPWHRDLFSCLSYRVVFLMFYSHFGQVGMMALFLGVDFFFSFNSDLQIDYF